MKGSLYQRVLVACVFVTLLLISNTIPGKMWAGLPWVGSLTVGVFCFPFVYLLSDVMSEVYGWRFARNMVWIAYLCNIIMCGFYALAIVLPAAAYMDPTVVNAYRIVLSSAPRVFLASLIAFPVGGLINARVVVAMKNALPEYRRSHSGLRYLRFFISTALGEGADVAIFMPLALAQVTIAGVVYGSVPLSVLPRVMVMYWMAKVVYESFAMPVSSYVSGRMLKGE